MGGVGDPSLGQPPYHFQTSFFFPLSLRQDSKADWFSLFALHSNSYLTSFFSIAPFYCNDPTNFAPPQT